MNRLLLQFIIHISLLHLLSLQTLDAQELSYRQFTTEDGLPSNQIYEICQDKKGYIWFGTENGLSRFDGDRFENFTIHDGIPDTEILGMYTDSKNRIWLRTLNGKIGFIQNGQFHNSKNTPFLKGQELDDFITGIVEDKAGNLYIFSKYYFLHLKPDNIFANTKGNISQLGLYHAKARNGDVFLSSPSSLLDTLMYRLPDLEETKFQESIFPPIQQQNFKLWSDNNITIKKILQLKKSDRNRVKEDKSTKFIEYNGATWLYGVTTPLQKLTQKKHKLQVETWENDLRLTCAIIDQTNKLWLGSPDKGVFLIRAVNSYDYKVGKHLEGGSLNSFFVDKKNKRIYIGSVDGWINVISEQTIWAKKIGNKTLGFPKIRSIKIGTKNELWVLSDLKVNKLNRNTLSPIPNFSIPSFAAPKFISITDNTYNGYLTTSRTTYSFSYEIDSLIADKISLYDNRSTCHYFDKENNRLWIGTPAGLLYSDDGAPANSTIKLLPDDPISFITKLDSTLIIGTNGKGIVLLKGNQIQRITSDNGLASNLVRSIYIHEDNSIWISTNQGLSLLKTTATDSLRFFTLNKDNSLMSNEVLDCSIIDSTLYVLSTKGVSVLSLNKLDFKQGIPIINIEEVFVNNIQINKDSTAKFSHQQNNLNIHFKCVYFGNRSELEYSYKLKGYHQDWKTTNSTNLFFEKLPPGEYQLELYPHINNKKGARTSTFSFEIVPAFYQRTWVQILAALLFILVVAYLIRLLFERQQEKSKIENRLLQLEQVALQSQMNPHFIKNALGAIQHLMLKKDVRTANKYLITFGELITQFLKQADQSTIKVKDELKVLELYLSIEKLRFDNNFKYTIDCSTEDLEECDIPSMMIQPLVENSIIHGFRDVGRDKINQVNITLKAQGEGYIICTISDNGLGIVKKDQQKKFVKKEGIALKNIRERMHLLSIQYPKSSFEILQTNNNGTSIQLCLPVK